MRTRRPSIRGAACVLGLDLSLTETGAVLLPLDWECEFGRARALVAGYGLPMKSSQREVAQRVRTIADAVRVFVEASGADVVGAYFEDYAYAAAAGAHQLGELRGVVRDAVLSSGSLRCGAPVVVLNQTAVRKLFFGAVPRLPREALKDAILEAVRRCGAPWCNHNAADAFLVANAGLAEHGSPAMTLA